MTDLNTISKILATPVPEILYHYTNSVGVVGIISSGKIRITKIHYLNDNLELQLAFDLIRNEIFKQLNDVSKTRTDQELEIMNSSLKSIRSVNVSVASFTEMGDQLSQWRGYCEIGNGYSLGFLGQQLRRVVDNSKYYFLVRCVYDESEQEVIAKELVDSIPVIDVKHHPNYGKPPFYEMDFKSSVLFIAPILKSASFAEEKEWRLISPPLSFSNAQFRHGSYSLIPYWEFDINLPQSLNSIIIGPTPEPDLSNRALEGLIAKTHPSELLTINITQSKIPFRQV